MHEVEAVWTKHYDLAKDHCFHIQSGVTCKNATRCTHGRRILDECVLTGNIIRLWGRLETWLTQQQKVHDDDFEGDEAAKRNAKIHSELGDGKRALKLVKATVENGPTLVGARVPVDKADVIKRNLKVSRKCSA